MKMAKITLFVIGFMIYCASEINASSCSDPQNYPLLVGTPSIEQLDPTTVKISVSTSLQNRVCADLILIKYWPSNIPDQALIKQINTMEMDADILVEFGVEYSYQVWAFKKSENTEFPNFRSKAFIAVFSGNEEFLTQEVGHFSKSSEILFKTSTIYG